MSLSNSNASKVCLLLLLSKMQLQLPLSISVTINSLSNHSNILRSAATLCQNPKSIIFKASSLSNQVKFFI